MIAWWNDLSIVQQVFYLIAIPSTVILLIQTILLLFGPFQREMIFPIGEPNTAYAQYFTGNSYLAPISREQVSISNVTFEPRCRNNWHIHHATQGGGQMLIGIAGRGWYQEEGKAAVEILPGTVIHIPANVKHWHGAAANSWFAHLAFELSGENTSNEWLEPVTDEEYDKIQMLP